MIGRLGKSYLIFRVWELGELEKGIGEEGQEMTLQNAPTGGAVVHTPRWLIVHVKR